jgi:hypothetical protein
VEYYTTNEKEELLKAEIHNVFLELLNDPSADRRQVAYGKFMDKILKWCNDYLYKRKENEYGKPMKLAEAMNKEIVEAVGIITDIAEKNKDKKKKIEELKNKDIFLKYVRKILHNKKNQYYRDRIEGPIREPKRVKDMRKILKWEEGKKGEPLTGNESVLLISMYLNLSEKTAREYYIAMNKKITNGLGFRGNNEQRDILDSDVSKPYMEADSFDLQKEVFSNLVMPELRSKLPNAVKMVLEKTPLNKTRKEDSKKLLRALFTGYCLDNEMIFKELIPVLDEDLLEIYKNENKKYCQYEIYQMHRKESKHPGVSAHLRLDEFWEELREFLNKNHQEIFLPDH